MLLFYVSFFISVSLFAYFLFGLFIGRKGKVEQRIEVYFESNTPELIDIAAAQVEALSFYERLVSPMWRKFKRKYNKNLDQKKTSEMEIKLLQAGKPFSMGPVEFKLFQTILFILLPAGGVGIGMLLNLSMTHIVLIAVVAFLMAMIYPRMLIKNKIEQRSRLAVKELPDILDLLTISLEAGLGFDAAISQVVAKKKGVLPDEFKVTLEEMRLGKTRKQALNALNDRILSEELKTLIYSIIQAETLGIGMVTVLRVQTEDIRERRRQKAEETAMKAPIKMMFPLVIFIFPSLFIILLGPAILQFLDAF